MNITTETKILSGVLIVTLLIIIGGSFIAERNGTVSGPSTLGEPVAQADRLVRDNSHATGPVEAAVTLVEFGDFQCPACGSLYLVLQQVKDKNPDVRFVWRHFPLTSIHDFAQGAAEAAEAASVQGKFFEYHDILFVNQNNLTRENLITYAGDIGLNVEAFTAALDSGFGHEAVQRDRSDGSALGVQGTPTLFINGARYNGRYSVTELQAAIDSVKRERAL